MAKNHGIKGSYPELPAGLRWNRGGTVAANFLAGGTPRLANCLMLINIGALNQVKILLFYQKKAEFAENR